MAVAPRDKGDSDHQGASIRLPSVSADSVTAEESTFRIIRYSGKNGNFMASINQPPHQIVNAKLFGPKVLRNDKDSHLYLSPYYPLNIVNI